MIRCEHCGSVLPDGAIFCGECGRAVGTGSARRTVEPGPVDRGTPPPLQQPDAHGRRQDPAAEAWLPEATLDPATRAWLTGADRRGEDPAAPVPVQTPDSFAPRSAPTHVHGSDSGLSEWAGGADADADAPAVEPPLDPDAFPSERVAVEDDPEVTRVAPRGDTSVPPVPPAAAPVAGPTAEPATPFWAPPAAPPAPQPPSAPSWWVGRSTSARAEEAAPVDEPVAPATDDGPSTGSVVSEPVAEPNGGAAGAPETVEPTAAQAEPVAEHTTGDRPLPGDTAVVEPIPDRRPSRPTPLVAPGSHAAVCHVCGHQLEPDDIFCGECGAVRPAVTAAFTGPVVPLPVARPDWAATDEAIVADDEIDDDDETAADDDERVQLDGARPDDDAADLDESPSGTTPAGRFAPGSPTIPSSSPRDPDTDSSVGPVLPPIPGVTGPVLPLPGTVSAPTSGDADDAAALDEDDDVDETRIVSRTPTRAPFVLHFSTGERIGLHGTGLLGRLPRPEATERFDDLLTVHDPGKSVSKTHLELGRDGDDLWVSDRFSGNGTVVRHIDGSIRRCEPGRRYRVERGARVDIGEQFFLVQ